MAVNFTIIDKVKAITTGNTLVVSGQTSNTFPPVNDDLTTISEATTESLLTPSGETTRDWTLSGSTAVLDLLENSTVEYAQLVWYSTIINNTYGAPDVTANKDDAVTFVTPSETITLAPEYTEEFIVNNSPSTRLVNYLRVVDVTSYVTNALNGNYTLMGVPTSIPTSGLSTTRSGWALNVVIKNPTFTPQYVSVSTGIEAATPEGNVQYFLSGFQTPEQTPVNGYLTLVAANGEPYKYGERLRIGSSFANLNMIGNPVGIGNDNPLTSPNNPFDNPFAGQINIANPLDPNVGLLNPTGTNAAVNNEVFTPLEVVGARNKWDILCMDIKEELNPNQTQLAFQLNSRTSTAVYEVVSKIVQLDALGGNLTATFEIDKTFLEVDKIATYRLQIENIGLVETTNVIVKDELDTDIAFVPDSIMVNGHRQIGEDITAGINIGALNPDEIITITYEGTPTKIEESPVFTNFATIEYTFTSGQSAPYTNVITTSLTSVEVDYGSLMVDKTVSTTTALLNETIEYTVTLFNDGSVDVRDVLITDILHPSVTFVPNSIYLNGVQQAGLDIQSGMMIAEIKLNETVTVSFSVTISEIPVRGYINNKVYTSYSYNLPQYLAELRDTVTAVASPVLINYTEITQFISNNNNYPLVGDIVTYTITLTNTGNEDGVEIPVQVTMPEGVTFVPQSLAIDGTPAPDLDPTVGFNLPEIAACTSVILTFDGLVEDIPADEEIVNIAYIPYRYQIDPNGNVIVDELESNEVVTRTNNVDLSVEKTVDKEYATIGEELVYEVTIKNTGNIKASNIEFSDILNSYLTFIPGSVEVNCKSMPDFDPNTGFNIGEIGMNDTATISFIAKVNAYPPSTFILNEAQVTFEYQPDPNRNPITDTKQSNTVSTSVRIADIVFNKEVDKQVAQIGDTLSYVLKVRNAGSVDLTDIYFSDPLPPSVSFIPGSVSINTIAYPELNPVVGFSIPNLLAVEETTISFSVTVTELPVSFFVKNRGQLTYSSKLNPNEPTETNTIDSNTVQTNILTPVIEIEKFVDKKIATLEEELTYSFVIKNKGNVEVVNLVFEDIIQADAEFIPNSVIVNGQSQPGFNPNNTFSIDDISVGDVSRVSFKVKVVSLPIPNIIENDSNLTFDYTVERIYSGAATSNTVETEINVGEMTVTKSVDKEFATLDDILTYSVILHNTGNVTNSNVRFVDLIPDGTEFIAESVIVNGIDVINANPEMLPLEDITAGSTTVVSFKVRVISVPETERVDNKADVTFSYFIDPKELAIIVTEPSNIVTTFINVQTVSIDKQVDKAYATLDDELLYTITLVNNGNVDLVQTNFVDLLDTNTPFKAGSVIIDGEAYPSFNPNNGFTLGSIIPNQNVIIQFTANVVTVPNLGYVNNEATLDYLYTLSPEGAPIPGQVVSNKTRTDIRLGELTIEKTVNREFSALNDSLTYTFLLRNIGNTDLSNLQFQDIIQVDGSSFEAGSVVINDISVPNVNPTTGFDLPDLLVGQTITMSFVASVTNVPSNVEEAIFNTATTNYDFLVEPQDSTSAITQIAVSNQTIVYVKDTRLTLTKAVNEDVAKINDILTYSFIVNNPGNVNTDNTFLFDTFDPNVSFIPGSVVINGVLAGDADPLTGIDLGTLLPDSTVTVSFTAQINSVPEDSIVENTGRVDYTYTIDTVVTQESVNSNTVETQIVTPLLEATKAVNKAYAEIEDELTYTVVVTNTGTVFAQSVTLTDVLDENITFVPGSVVINGQAKPTETLEGGISVPNLAPEEVATISFYVTIDTLPQIPYNIFNKATIDFMFIDPITSVLTPGPTATTNTVQTTVIDEELSIVKSVDKAYATLDEELVYTVVLHNTGNVLLSNVVITDPIQTDAAFIAGSITIDNNPYPDLDIESFVLPFDIAVDQEVMIQFKVIVNTLPNNDYIYNTAQADYSYIVNPTEPSKRVQRLSNRVETKINIAIANATKSVNKVFATTGDTLLYTIEIINNGTVTLTDLNFLDLVAQGASFVPGSVYVDGVNRPTANPNNSISLNSIPIGQATIVKFNVVVEEIPAVNPLPNKADVTYTYQIDPQGEEITNELETNTVTTQINEGVLTLVKAVDKEFALVGDELTYTVITTNEGNVPLTELVFRDVLQSELSFVVNSVTINEAPVLDVDPETGFALPDLGVGEFATIEFKTTINELPTSSFVENTATTAFAYKINPTGPTIHETETSNTVRTDVRELGVTLRKLVDKEFATVTNTLLYSNILTNVGTVPLTDVFFFDDIPAHTEFIPGSVYVGSQLYPDLDVSQGIDLGVITPGETRTITFSVRIIELPLAPDYLVTNISEADYKYKIDPNSPDDILGELTSNEVTTRVNLEDLQINKAVNREYALVNDLIVYTVTLENAGNINLTNIIFSDELQEDLSFISGTVTIDGIQREGLNPEVGFNLPDLEPGDEIIVTFDSRLTTLPSTFKVDNFANTQYKYQIDPTGSVVTTSKQSNLVTTLVVNPVLASSKAVSKEYATLDDIITYTITLNNTGNVDLENVLFRDTPSTGVEFVAGTVAINGVTDELADPTQGIQLDTLTKNTITTVTFDVLVTSVPASGVVTNKAFIDYEYTVDPTQPPIEETSQTNLVTTVINVVNTEVVKAVDKQFATLGDILNYTVTVTNKGNIPNTNVRFVDPTPANSTFVLGSVIVNGVPETTFNPEAGFNLGTLQPEQVVTVEYQVRVIQ